MRKALIAFIAGGALATVAAPALAQSFDPGIAHREDNLRFRINEGERDGSLTMGQADRLRDELSQIVDLDARYQSDGMQYWQRRDLNSRLSLLGSRVNYDSDMNNGY